MLQKLKYCQSFNVSNNVMSLKLKCQGNLNVLKTKMLQEPNVIKTRRSALIALALFFLMLGHNAGYFLRSS